MVTHDNKISVEHVVEPVFLSIVNESEVVVHLPEHIAQRTCGDMGGALFDNAAVMWRALIATDGRFDAVGAAHLDGALREHVAKLGEESSQAVDRCGALLDEPLSRPMQAQIGLLLELLTGTKRMLGRLTASQIASAPPSASTPCTEKTFFARSIPTVVTSLMGLPLS